MIRIATVLALIANLPPASAQSPASLSADYVCGYGLQPHRRQPQRGHRRRRRQLHQRVRRPLSRPGVERDVNKTGVLAADGVTLRWSDGVVWKRRL